MEYEFEKICRVCLNQDEKMMSVFKVNVSRKIMACASVQVWPNDELPSQICHKCCAKLHVAYQYKKQCEKSDSKLRTYLAKRRKSNLNQKQESQNEIIKEQENMKHHQENISKGQVAQQNAIEIQPQNNCLYVECNGEIMDVQVQEPTFTQNGSIQQTSIAHMNNYSMPQPTLQEPLQIGNYNIQNVIYSTSYPVSMHPLQPTTNLIHNQVVTSLQLHQQAAQHPQSQLNIQQPVVPITPINKNTSTTNSSISDNIDKLKNAEKPPDNSNQCSICFKVFLNATKKNRHMKIHSKTDMPYKCTVCSKEFMHGGNYKIHMRMHNDDRPFCCTICPKRFVQAQDLEKHTRTHTGERPHKCPMCWKAFSTGSNLIAHIRTHTGERPYVCSVCTKAFCQSNELTKHMRTHTGEKSHKCDICNKGFNGSSTLIVHKRSHTGEKPFECKICDKSFTQSSCLSAHLKRYGETKFPCDVCTTSFHSDKVLQEHLKSEHNQKLFKCQTCGKDVGTTQSDFDKHIISEHIDPLPIDGS